MEIKVGDVVQLKSGGPEMTVDEIEPYNGIPKARCSWFDGPKKDVGVFPLTSLRVAE